MVSRILDTDICVHWLKGSRQIESMALKTGLESIATTAITLCELHYGAQKSSRPEDRERAVSLLASKIQVLALTPDIGPVFGELKASLEKQGAPLDDADLLIASCCLRHQAVLVTNNTRHFQRVPNLKLENWLST
ncbi:MAG: PIN domain-containing protein [Elusimicrobia bacterium]|nr:PIN domain-containing protein [Elusimicrobiota bacterium]